MKKNRYPTKLSVVIPLFNEENRFEKNFRICKKWQNRFPNWEFIFVNDGSNDKTENLIREKIKNKNNFKLISYSQNQGKGYAVKKGIMAAKNLLVLFCDIDFSTPLSQLKYFYEEIKKGAQVVIGTRKIKKAKIIEHQPKLREFLGRSFTLLTNLILGLNVSDYTCGFKMFKTKIAKSIFNKQKIKRWSFDAELLFLTDKKKYKIAEIAVIWKNDKSSKVSIFRDIVISFFDLIKIRVNNFLGKYE